MKNHRRVPAARQAASTKRRTLSPALLKRIQPDAAGNRLRSNQPLRGRTGRPRPAASLRRRAKELGLGLISLETGEVLDHTAVATVS